MQQVRIEPHTTIDKSFRLTTPHVTFNVYYDDVDHAEVDAAVKLIQSIIYLHWDEDMFKNLLYAERRLQFEADKYLIEEYNTFENYLKEIE